MNIFHESQVIVIWPNAWGNTENFLGGGGSIKRGMIVINNDCDQALTKSSWESV